MRRKGWWRKQRGRGCIRRYCWGNLATPASLAFLGKGREGKGGRRGKVGEASMPPLPVLEREGKSREEIGTRKTRGKEAEREE